MPTGRYRPSSRHGAVSRDEFSLLKYLFQKNTMEPSYRARREGFRHLAPNPVFFFDWEPARNDSGPDTSQCQVRSSGFRRLSVILMDAGTECNHKLQKPGRVMGRSPSGFAVATGELHPAGLALP